MDIDVETQAAILKGYVGYQIDVNYLSPEAFGRGIEILADRDVAAGKASKALTLGVRDVLETVRSCIGSPEEETLSAYFKEYAGLDIISIARSRGYSIPCR